MTLRASQFSWKGGDGCAEASDIGLLPGDLPRTLTLVSDRTGDERQYSYEGALRHGGEVSGWTYRHGTSKVTVLND